MIATLRRDCVDHMIIFSEASLRLTISPDVRDYHESRTHLSLEKDAPESRPVQAADAGRIVSISQVGGLHHRCERCAA